jgi:V-type H+-transporting ATPase subunit H
LCLAYMLRAGCPSQLPPKYKNVGIGVNTVAEPLQALINWLASRLQSSRVTSLGVVTPTLVVLSTCHEARIVLDRAGGIGYLSRHLRVVRINHNHRDRTLETSAPSSPTPPLRRNQNGNGNSNLPTKGSSSKNSASVQQLYELCFCLWTMTYECEAHLDIRQHFHRDGAVAALVQLVASAPREKVVRLALSALVNLAACENNSGSKIGGSTFLTEMIGCNLMKSIDLLKERQWSDPDIVEGTSWVGVCCVMCGEG